MLIELSNPWRYIVGKSPSEARMHVLPGTEKSLVLKDKRVLSELEMFEIIATDES
jgi:hypothetical protein